MNTGIVLHMMQQCVGMYALLDRLLWAAIEMTFLSALVWIGLRVFRNISPRVRALLWLLVLIKPLAALVIGAAVPVLEIGVAPPSPTYAAPAPATAPVAHKDAGLPSASYFERGTGTAAAPTRPQPAALPAPGPVAATKQAKSGAFAAVLSSLARRAASALPGLLVLAWTGAVLLFALYKIADFGRLHWIVRRGQAPDSGLMHRYAAAADALGVKRRPRLIVTDAVESPALAGAAAPVILTPAWMTDEAHEVALNWALRHELIHWKHGDTLANMFRQAAQVLFFFHPLVWWAGHHWEKATELACDRALVRTSEEARQYAYSLYHVLAQLKGQRQRALAGGLFATRTQVGERIAALLSNPLRHPAKLGGGVMLVLFLVAATALATGGAFSSAKNKVAIGGIVVDDADAPVEGAIVSVSYGSCPDSYSAESKTDAEGRWRLEIEEGVTKFTQSINHPDFVIGNNGHWWNVTEALKAGAFRQVLSRGTRISGEVVDAAGAPISGAVVAWGTLQIDDIKQLRERLGSGKGLPAVATDEAGRYSIMVDMTPLHPGLWDRRSLTVFSEGYAPQAFLLDGSTDNYRVTLDAGAVLEGTVLDDAGNPITGAKIVGYEWMHHLSPNDLVQMWVGYIKAETDASGKFSIPCQPNVGMIEYQMRKNGYYDRRFFWCAQEASLASTYRLYAKTPLRGRVLDASTGEPVKRFEIGTSQHDEWEGFFDKDGAFELEKFALHVRAKGYCITELKTPPVQERAKAFLEVALKPGKRIVGRVLSVDGRPACNANVACVLPGQMAFIEGAAIRTQYIPSPLAKVDTDTRGAFEMYPSDPPGLLVVVHASGWQVQPMAAYDANAPIVLIPWSRIKGKCALDYAGQGNDVPSMCAELAQPDPWNAGDALHFRMDTSVTEDGDYSIDYVPALPLQVGQGRRGVLSHAQRIEPAPGATVEVNLYGDHAGTVQGQLLREGIPGMVEGPHVAWNDSMNLFISARLKEADPDNAYAHYVPYVLEDGSFTLKGLPVGNYVLEATLHGPVTPYGRIGGRGLALAKWTREFSIAPDLTAPVDLGALHYEISPPLQPGQAAPEIKGATLEGADWLLSNERGKPVLMILWASCDSASRVRIPSFQELYQRYGADGHLRIIGVSLDYHADGAKGHLADAAAPWAHQQILAGGRDQRITCAYGGESLPSCWLLDAQGAILDANIPQERLEQALKKALEQ